MNKKGILVVGDLHGKWELFNNLLNYRKPIIVLQCGDYG